MAKTAATPAARRTAEEKNIDIAAVRGTGIGGYVQRSDVLAFQGSADSGRAAKNSGTFTPLAKSIASYFDVDLASIRKDGPIRKADVLDYKANLGADRILSLDKMRSAIAQHMSESMSVAPQYTMMADIDCFALKRFMKDISEMVIAEMGIKPTYSDLFVKACAIALVKNPMINASFMGDHILLKSSVNIGIAVSLGDRGLIVPNIKNTQTLSLAEIALQRNDLVKRARAGKLLPDEFSGGTFTISNLGISPVQYFTPIINLPESAILGVGSMADRVVPIDGGVGVRPICGISLTSDHRTIDGTTGEQFIQDLKEILENPEILEGE
ncbi:hypothetical protein AGMMS49983_05000 [Clostridia bacterium]|nr:hypothetical protein AGMMS49983_05000 [Clostridia bacterium]